MWNAEIENEPQVEWSKIFNELVDAHETAGDYVANSDLLTILSDSWEACTTPSSTCSLKSARREPPAQIYRKIDIYPLIHSWFQYTKSPMTEPERTMACEIIN